MFAFIFPAFTSQSAFSQCSRESSTSGDFTNQTGHRSKDASCLSCGNILLFRCSVRSTWGPKSINWRKNYAPSPLPDWCPKRPVAVSIASTITWLNSGWQSRAPAPSRFWELSTKQCDWAVRIDFALPFIKILHYEIKLKCTFLPYKT